MRLYLIGWTVLSSLALVHRYIEQNTDAAEGL